MKNKSDNFLGTIVVALLIGIYVGTSNNRISQKNSNRSESVVINSDESARASRNSSVTGKPEISNSIPKKRSLEIAQSYFQTKMLEDKNVAEMYRTVKNRMSKSQDGELVAVYSAQVLGRNGSPAYASFYLDLMAAIKANSESVFEEIVRNDLALESDPFTHQVALNLVSDLDMPTDQKVKFMGRVLERPFQVNGAGQISPESAALTIALIQMRKANIPLDEVRPYIEHGLQQNLGDKRGLSEYLARVTTYYPEFHEDGE